MESKVDRSRGDEWIESVLEVSQWDIPEWRDVYTCAGRADTRERGETRRNLSERPCGVRRSDDTAADSAEGIWIMERGSSTHRGD